MTFQTRLQAQTRHHDQPRSKPGWRDVRAAGAISTHVFERSGVPADEQGDALAQISARHSPPPRTFQTGLLPWQRDKVVRYMQANLDGRLRLDELAALVQSSAGHFCAAFRVSFGTTPHKHITKLRLALAKRLMVTTEDPLSQIALDCGFTDQSHLSNVFRRAVGETPAAWRRRNRLRAAAEGDEATVRPRA